MTATDVTGVTSPAPPERRYGTPRPRRVPVRVLGDLGTLDLGSPTRVERRAALMRALAAFDRDGTDDALAAVAEALTMWRRER